MIQSNTDIKKSYELVLEAETIATVEDNESLIIDAKLAVIENLLFQKNVSSITEKVKDVEELISSLEETDVSKNEKFTTLNALKSTYSSLLK